MCIRDSHDILPGSSIKEVYDDSKEEYEAILSANREYTDRRLGSLAEHVNAPKHSVVVYNPNSMNAEEAVCFPCPEDISYPAVKTGEECLPVQKMADGTWMSVSYTHLDVYKRQGPIHRNLARLRKNQPDHNNRPQPDRFHINI